MKDHVRLSGIVARHAPGRRVLYRFSVGIATVLSIGCAPVHGGANPGGTPPSMDVIGECQGLGRWSRPNDRMRGLLRSLAENIRDTLVLEEAEVARPRGMSPSVSVFRVPSRRAVDSIEASVLFVVTADSAALDRSPVVLQSYAQFANLGTSPGGTVFRGCIHFLANGDFDFKARLSGETLGVLTILSWPSVHGKVGRWMRNVDGLGWSKADDPLINEMLR